MNPSTLTRLRAEAEAYADMLSGLNETLSRDSDVRRAIRDSFLRGASAGYVEAKAESREP